MPEVEKREVERTEPEAPARKKSKFEFVALAWLVLLAAALGASLYYLLPSGNWLGRPLSEKLPVRPAHIAAAALGVTALLAARRVFEGRLDWIKPREGRGARLVAYLATIAMGIFAGVSLYRIPELDSRWWTSLGLLKFLGKEFALRPIFFPSAAVGLLVGAVAHYLYGRPKWTDFLIETEGELRKVSWPPRKEWVGSSVVVILVVAITALFLWACDEFLTWLMLKTNLGF